ncbi:serine protease [Carboxylicivirga sp. M1479]|uniref:S1 family peptidase n=1 Tax=Carboxylicivirga sp. M1479 TaxID=2594476 RepID=UPI00117782E4|nr:serine protease [Carboxylicivirga sp. M1479]TRX72113.1 trypsin-like peptidase domain-containing protein [Carboxylicivirga sp. M1479]
MNIYKMTKQLLFIGLYVALAACQTSHQQQKSPKVETTKYTPEEAINDNERLKLFESMASAEYRENGGVDADTYKKQLSSKHCEVPLEEESMQKVMGYPFYNTFRNGVLMIGKMYKCGHCPEDHISSASAFAISEDGICVTNYHVFKSYDPTKPNDYITFYVMDYEQNMYPVTEVLAASKHDDLAIFKIDTKGKKLNPLALGNELGCGEAINLISHPDHRFYTYTQGHINRKYIKPGSSKIRQSISAEFAKGSSGAPIMDVCGNVVGVVAGTQNIYYDQEGKIYQNTIKEMIPVSRLKELIN